MVKALSGQKYCYCVSYLQWHYTYMRYQSSPGDSSEQRQETTRERAERQRLERRAELTYTASDEKRWAENRERVLRERRTSEPQKPPERQSRPEDDAKKDLYFIGYHGTSEKSAVNIINTGVRRECLPPTGQIGPGFYVAKVKGKLPDWGASLATEPERSQEIKKAKQEMTTWQRMLSYVSGNYPEPDFSDKAKKTILKIYSTQPLKQCKWNIMNPPDLNEWQAILDDAPSSRSEALDDLIKKRSVWLQMVVAPDELPFLVAFRDDGKAEQPTHWEANEAP